jgi:hypothetical protein
LAQLHVQEEEDKKKKKKKKKKRQLCGTSVFRLKLIPLNGRVHFGDLGTDKKIIFQMYLKEVGRAGLAQSVY